MTDPEKLLGKGVERRRKAEEIIREAAPAPEPAPAAEAPHGV